MPANQKLIKQTDQCVMCGLCLPHCPTYLISQNEGESPRGRISLIKAFAEGSLTASPSLENHLQSCTGCMNCQSACPAKVPYQEIIDQGRELYRGQQRITDRLLHGISLNLLGHSWGHSLLGIASHLKTLAPIRMKIALSRYRPARIKPTASSSQAITLFPGCTGNVFDQETLSCSMTVLKALNINAQVPADVLCCGALAQHSGHTTKAQHQLRKFSDYLHQQENHACISFASGCGQQLGSFASKYNYRHYDIHDYLAEHSHIDKMAFNPLAKKVLVHVPCSQGKVSMDNMLKLLRLIPDIHLLEYNEEMLCCGAGGMQLLTPRKSNLDLLNKKIALVEKSQPDIIVSANIGCTLHLLNGLNYINPDIAKKNIEVIHPVTLLSRQLQP